MKLNKKKIIWTGIILIVALLVVVFSANTIIECSTDDYIYSDLEGVPYNKVGLVLGTSRYLRDGSPNQYFANRVKAAAALYYARKINYIVVSGDNGKTEYNEPLDLKVELVKLGIPDSVIYLDYAGFRTYDSVIRLNKIFGQSSFTVISQEFHNRRAIFIAKHNDLAAIGYNARDVDLYNGFKTQVREKIARLHCFIDLLFASNPKFLGEKIEIG